MRDLAQEVVRMLGSKSVLEMVPYESAYAAGFEDMRRRRPDITKLRKLTGFSPHRSLPEIIRAVALQK